MAESFWAAAGPSRPTASSFVAAPAPMLAKKKRGRFSDSNSNKPNATTSIPSIVNPPSPELVPRHSSSAGSWGIEDLSDSDGDYDWPPPSPAAPLQPPNASLDLDRDELAKFARPSKRVHLETPEDRHTYGKLAGLQIDPSALATSAPNQPSFGRPHGVRSNSGVAGAFGLSASLASAFGANADGLSSAPRVPPSSPTKSDALPSSFGGSASTIYQQAVAPAPPTSPSAADRGLAPPSSPLHAHIFAASAPATSPSTELQDSDMRLRRGIPSSYEVEPDRIVVTSLDDTSSSEGGESTEVEGGQKTPDADTSTESKDSTSDFVINNELMEKLEAHSRAVLTGTSDRDNAASNSRSSGGASGSTSRSRRSGRRSGGTAMPSLGSLLSCRRRSAQSSPGSSGYASPINAEDARGALILWKDPEEVLKSSATSTSSPLKQSDLATVPESGPAASNFMSQPPVSFQSTTSSTYRTDSSTLGTFGESRLTPSTIPGMAALPSSSPQAVESPLYAQQSSLSSSYFPQPSTLQTRFANHSAQQNPPAFGSVPANHVMAPRSHHDQATFGQTHHASASSVSPLQHPYQPQQHQHYGFHYNSHPQATSQAISSSLSAAHGPSQHAHTLGAQPIDLSGHFGPAEMDLDN
ncbi:uncharacterized protein SPSC_05942 [Sporisorium scitamineum]|uniref:Uncharacterized protein n=1 Tax=Sporisorium scitamineum TaxID=49012 RepID=A0A0F7SDL5_9BASI|nr:uncharacterized protein SPSC_05942 [Sporisorium scitamineum]CDW99675.1 hypothetical protein [Sporisorium scitamineum]